MMDDNLLNGTPPKAKKKAPKKKAKKKRDGLEALDDVVAAKHHLVHVNVNVVNSAGDQGKKKMNEADDALKNLRGY